MIQPSLRAVLTLAPLLLGAVAVAQPQPAPRERQVISSREVVLPDDVAGSVPVVRVAPGVRTYVAFGAPIRPDSVKLEGEGTHVRLVAVGDAIVALELLTELGTERAVLRATYADGQSPREATLALMSDPTQVDKEVQVKRRPQSEESLEAELTEMRAREKAKDAELASLRARCEASGALGLVLSRLLDEKGLTTTAIQTRRQARAGGPSIKTGWVNAATGWVVLAVEVENPPGQAPWTPDSASLTSAKTGQPVKVRAVRLTGPAIPPGETGLVGIETDSPPTGAGDVFRLEVWEAATGRRVAHSDVRIEKPE